MADNGYDISDYQDVDPLFGSLARPRRADRGLHERGMKLVMDLVVNHTSAAHPWFEESRSSGTTPSGTGTGGGRRDRARAGHPGAEPTNWGSAFSGPAWTYDAATGEYYLHLFAPEQPDLNWENPEVRQAVYAMMSWWLDRGVDGFRMDVINLHLQGRRCPTALGAPLAGDARYGDTRRRSSTAPASTSSCRRCTARCSPAAGRAAQRRRDARRHRRAGAALHRPGARELDMVFQFEHVDLDSGPGGKWDIVPMTMLDLKRSLGRWQDGLADVGWNSLYSATTTSRAACSRFGNDAPSTASSPPRRWRRCCTCTAARRTSTRATSSA